MENMTWHKPPFFAGFCQSQDGKKRLYILGERRNRDRAYDECKDIIDYKLSSGSRQVSSWRSRYSPPRGGYGAPESNTCDAPSCGTPFVGRFLYILLPCTAMS
jgi:hypothetical protein